MSFVWRTYLGWVEWGGTTVALHRPHGSQGCTRHLRARAVSERLARARFADSLCALAFARKREGGRQETPASSTLLTSRECARLALLLWCGWGRCGETLRARRGVLALASAHHWPR